MFLEHPEESEAVARIFDSDVKREGYVMNLTRLWAWRPDVFEAFTAARMLLTTESTLSDREVAVTVCSPHRLSPGVLHDQRRARRPARLADRRGRVARDRGDGRLRPSADRAGDVDFALPSHAAPAVCRLRPERVA